MAEMRRRIGNIVFENEAKPTTAVRRRDSERDARTPGDCGIGRKPAHRYGNGEA